MLALSDISTGAGIAGAAAIFAMVKISFDLMNMFFMKKGEGFSLPVLQPALQSTDCKYQHSSIMTDMSELKEATKELLKANADFLRNTGVHNAMIEQRLTAIEKSLERLELKR